MSGDPDAEAREASPGGAVPGDSATHTDIGLALSLNRMGSFDWDLDTGRMHLDDSGLAVFDLDPADFDGWPIDLKPRVPTEEGIRLDAVVSQALKDGSQDYGVYFRVRRRDGSLQWTHTQGSIRRDETGRARRVIGIVRDATLELDFSRQRLALDAERERQARIVESTTAALAHARTVRDVIGVLGNQNNLKRLGAVNVLLGLVEDHHIQLVAEGTAGSYVHEHQYTDVDEDAFPMGQVVRTMRPLFITSAEEFADGYPHLWPYIEPLGITAAAYLPLVALGRPNGVLGLFYAGRHEFTPEERNLLLALASTIAQSLERARLYDQEHDLAERLQQAMLPPSIPDVPGAEVAVRYRSPRTGLDIGGDWYDVIPLPRGRVAAVIGDVQGHDTQAAAVMGQLRIVLRAYATEGHSPATVMARASSFLYELDTERFATCCYTEIDLATGSLQVVRAGHIDPLVRHPDGITRWLAVPGGLPLGLSADFGRLEYPVTRLTLDPGDALLLCTDGLLEQPGTDLGTGMLELRELVAAGPCDVDEMADRLCDVVEERGVKDDMALVLLRRGGGALRTVGKGESAGRLRQHIPPADPDALSAARHMIRSAVRAWGAGERADEIELVADELVTNALLHTDGPAEATVRMVASAGPDRRLRIEVEDRSSAMPRRREPGESGVSGRGLLLVDRLADVWGVEARGSGKVIWCEFAVAAEPVLPAAA
ncbi:SpoIIE family protein phosphatase [Streptomyces sp. A7024]|uniref:protein-serine/threonine phosphatase n=1 Tax=Streptomyces coryli TaxID=1128680 RepID=A0A6G4UA75_9ACTN|nr:SpoIIE family protein phosphatase [Streptomyces coryli]